MGYTFRIGQLIESVEIDDDEEYTTYNVEGVTHDDAPVFPNDEMTGQSNGRSPSYSAWAGFCRDVGIFELFYDNNGYMHAGHPGYQSIDQDTVDYIKQKLKEYTSVQRLPPGFDGFPVYDPLSDKFESPDGGKYDPMLARLMWLDFWCEWAVKNCENPVIVNW